MTWRRCSYDACFSSAQVHWKYATTHLITASTRVNSLGNIASLLMLVQCVPEQEHVVYSKSASFQNIVPIDSACVHVKLRHVWTRLGAVLPRTSEFRLMTGFRLRFTSQEGRRNRSRNIYCLRCPSKFERILLLRNSNFVVQRIQTMEFEFRWIYKLQWAEGRLSWPIIISDNNDGPPEGKR